VSKPLVGAPKGAPPSHAHANPLGLPLYLPVPPPRAGGAVLSTDPVAGLRGRAAPST